MPHHDVSVFCYTEVNLVVDAMHSNKSRVVNRVLPFVRLDAVSYSSYDVMRRDEADVHRTLDFILAHCNSSQTQLLIGEFAMPADDFNYDGVLHAEANIVILRKFISWRGKSAATQQPITLLQLLYWEFYSNERSGTDRDRGYWLIDDRNVKQPLYHAFQRFYHNASAYVQQYRSQHSGREPSRLDFLTDCAQPFFAWYNVTAAAADNDLAIS